METTLPSPVTSEHRSTAFKLKQSVRNWWDEVKFTFTTREGILGDTDYKALFTPTLPFTKHTNNPPVFHSLHARLPLFLTILLGLQHAAAMLGGLISAPLVLAQTCRLDDQDTDYMISISLLGSGVLTLLQLSRFRIPRTHYYVGTGLISVLGPAFTSLTVMSNAVPVMYKTGYCETTADGTQLPCRKGMGALLATGALCALVQLLVGFVPTRVLTRILPPTVTGPVVLLIGCSLTQSAVQNWGGGSGCFPGGLCNTSVPSHSHPWGSGQWIGLGFSVIIGTVVCDRYGPPIMKSCSIVIGLIIGCIIAAATGYFDHKSIDAAPNGQFFWVRTFPLHLYGPLVLPMLAVHIVTIMENVGDITATADVSRVDVEGRKFDSRIQGGNVASGLASIAGCLMTLMPVCTFSQNNGVVSMTQVSSLRAGYACCVWLIIMGVIGKFSAAINAIPEAVIGGMTVILFSSVAVAGLAIVGKSQFDRRDRMVVTLALVFGLASLLEPTWFSSIFTYKGNNKGKQGFIEAIEIFVEAPYAIAGFAGVIAHLLMPLPPKEESKGSVIEMGSSIAASEEDKYA